MKLLTSTLSVDHFLSLLLFSLVITSIAASEDEVRSLLEFRKGIRIDPLGKIQNSWNLNSLDPSTCPNSFYGVYCDVNEKVAAIDLNQLGLEGDIKFSTLIGLKMLRNLSLSGNLLTGRFVPALGLMSSLQHLDLSNNQFVGPIPARISELWGLNYLNLSSNNFSSGFPSGISNLQQLRVLDLHSNFLSGDVHDLLWELRNVEHVDLSNNLFYGSVSMDVMNISSMVNTVQYVNLSHNKLNGEFFGAESVSLFKNLKVLDLGDNQLTGELPSFGSLPDLSVLLLGNNQLYGSIPEELLQSSIPLVELDLSGNGFSGSLREINSTTLHTLNLSSNSLSGSLPSSLGSCVIVDLSKNMLSEDISVMQNWEPTLEVLDLSSNQLTGIIPNLTSEFTNLTTLNIRNNSIKGNLPSVFGTYPKLSSIDLSSNGLDGPIPKGFFSSMTLTTLNLSKNHFTGPIPLQGSHSSELLFLSSYPPIESIDLSDNSLTGNLPSEIGSLGRLKLINLSKNQLSGFLPDELNKLSTLEYLDLSTNDFTGKIPDKLPSSLKLLNVSHNNLSGKVPENLKSFPGNSFFPGNTLLIFPDSGQSPAAGVPSQILDNKSRKSKLSMRIVAVIVASVAAAIMIAFVLTIYSRGKIKDFRGRSGFTTETTSREIKIKPPTSLSFSNDHLLTSSNQAADVVSTEIVEHAATSATSAENPNLIDIDPSSTSPVSSSPVILDVYSPDRLAGELFLLDNSIDFTAGELSRAPAEVLGRSSHGTLYKATLDSGHMLTVKWLRVGLVKNKKEFAKEVKKIGAIRHQNVVPLRAYYWGPREQERLVLADYIQGDSLALHLYESTPRRYSLLSLTQRVKVAVDVARCLLYLHNQNLPHGNLKPTNIILIGSNYDAKLTDFGLHKLMTPAGIAEQILNLGALGYRAPELASTNKPVISFKADVYAFGVILMELLTRRSAGDIISGQSGAVDLTDWVKLCDQEGRGLDCIDRDIGGENLNSDAMNDLLRISIRCVSPVNERPNIRQVFDDICSISV